MTPSDSVKTRVPPTEAGALKAIPSPQTRQLLVTVVKSGLEQGQEAGADPADRAGELEAGHPGGENLDQGPQVDAGEGGAEAEVGAEPEGEVGLG